MAFLPLIVWGDLCAIAQKERTMSQPFIGEIRMFGGSFAPAGWAFCSGQLMPISQNDALFTLIGTTYGGDGEETFALPDFQGRIPIHQGTGPGIGNTFTIGEKAGVESVTLTVQQIPTHTHVPLCQPAVGANAPTNAFWASHASAQIYSAAGPSAGTNFNNSALGVTGGSQPHDNMMPFLVVSFIISLFGIFPTQT
jgi:microcystin-dependent protein